MNAPAKRISPSVDWLTLTTREASRGGDWFDVFQNLAAEKRSEGFHVDAATLLGYTGHRVGRVFVGARSDGWMCRISGDWADAYGSLFQPDGCRCTRIDLAVTEWRAESGEIGLARLWETLKRRRTPAGQTTNVKLWSDSTGPQGIGFGSRSSQRYARIYDKWKESGDSHYRDAVRYEVEFKADVATQAAYVVFTALNRREAIIDLVRNHFAHWGVDSPGDSTGNYILASAPGVTPDVFVQLRWLRNGVAPTVARLVERVGVDIVARALFSELPQYLDSDVKIALEGLDCTS